MKIFDSGMPDESYWNTLFDMPRIVDWLDLKSVTGPMVEIGCGYGTFTVPVAAGTLNHVYAFDVEPSMIAATGSNIRRAGLVNVDIIRRDVVSDGTGLEAGSAAMVLLFNILHFKKRRVLLEEAARIIRPDGVVAIIHWRKDIPTPRGPEIDSRPDTQIILDEIPGLNLSYSGDSRILEPYHWGMKLSGKIQQRGNGRMMTASR